MYFTKFVYCNFQLYCFGGGRRVSGVPLNYSIPGKHAADMAFARILLRQPPPVPLYGIFWLSQKPYVLRQHKITGNYHIFI